MEHYQFKRTINAKREVVHAMLTDIQLLEQWWENQVNGDPKAGGELRFLVDPQDYSIMKVEKASRSNVLWTVLHDTGFEGEWVGTQIQFELTELDEDRTQLHFQHIGLTPDLTSYEPCTNGWNHYLTNIIKLSEQKHAITNK